MRTLLVCIPLLLLLFISSCCHNVSTKCATGSLNIYVTGVSESDMHASPSSSMPPYAVRYLADNTFSSPIDSFMIGSTISDGDTFALYFNDPQSTGGVNDSLVNGLLPGYDYKIVIPADTLTFLLTNVVLANNNVMELKKCGDKSPPQCYKNIVSCNVNGIATTPKPVYGNTNITNLYQYPSTFIYLSR